MGRIQPSISDDVVNYHLPIGLLGLVNQIANLYVYLAFTCGRRPLQPKRTIQYPSYSIALCVITIIFILGFDSDSMSHLDRWELITSVAGNMVLFVSYVGIALGGLAHCREQAKASQGPQADAIETSPTTTTVDGDVPPPPYSEDPERGDAVIDDKAQASSLAPPYVTDHEIVGAPENPSNRMPSKEAEVTDSGSSSTIKEEDATKPVTTETQAQSELRAQLKAQKASDTGATVYMLVINMPGTILVFAGLVGQLAHNLPAEWVDTGRLRTIIFAHSIFLAATVFGMAVWLVRLSREQPPTDEEVALRRKLNWKDCIFQCSMIFSFFIVSFDKWLLASLVGDLTGAKHILSDHSLPLAYMLITKLPVLAL